MKTLKQHMKEGHMQAKYGAGNVGAATSNSVEDSALGAHNIQDPDVLQRVNAFVPAPPVTCISDSTYYIYFTFTSYSLTWNSLTFYTILSSLLLSVWK